MIIHDLARAIANIAIFLEFSSEDIFDEDRSVEVMEQLASDLRELDDNSRRELSVGFLSIASTYRGEERSFVEGLPDAFGIE